MLLVPELSFMTGIPDKMRKDFIAMKVNIQDLPFVLELARPHSCSSTMQGCPQTGFPVWSVPALGTSHPAFR
ncbi:Piwi-like protein 2 [Channa argus]|uniref:Piwi-like protein 2 n=1 Tax=Channa argus TaxID=215402 RepID=A0A6G1Q0I7_CHAAH|nr:Piwi-like protein 2 [Channa argus]